MAARSCFSKFTDEKFLKTVPMGLFRQLLEDEEYKGKIDLDIENLSPESLRAFFLKADDTMPEQLLGDMHLISKMATATGMNVLVTHAQAKGEVFERPDAKPGEDPTEGIDPKWLSLHCFLNFREIFDSAQRERIYERQSTFDEYTGKKEGRLKEIDDKIPELEELLGSYFMEEYQGDLCRITPFDEEGEQKFLIKHGLFWKVDIRIKNNKEIYHSGRPPAMSVAEYDPLRGVLRINAKKDKDRDEIVKVFGDVFFKDENYFETGNTVTLEPLLDPGFSYDWTWDSLNVESVTFTELQIMRNADRNSHVILKSRDVLADLKEMKDIDLSLLSKDDLVYAKILFKFTNKKSRYKSIRVKPKNKIVMGRAAHVSTVHNHLRRMGILKDGKGSAQPGGTVS